MTKEQEDQLMSYEISLPKGCEFVDFDEADLEMIVLSRFHGSLDDMDRIRQVLFIFCN